MMSVVLNELYADCEKSWTSIDTARLEPLRDSSVFITGATGFVGLWISVFCAFLNDKHNFGVRVRGVARREARLVEKAPFLIGRPDYAFEAVDVRDLVQLSGDVQWVVHAAGSPDSRDHATDPFGTMSIIADGTARILRLAEQSVGLRAILHFSSASVYGPNAFGEDFKDGDANAPHAIAAYAQAKRYSEVLCASARSQLRLPVIITRPFTFLGPFQSPDAPWAANNFIHAAASGQPLKVLGDGETRRGYLYGSDMAALALCQMVGGASGSVYNLGATEMISLRELAETVEATSQRRLEIRYNTGGGKVAASVLKPDMTKSATEFGFSPSFHVSEAIARAQAWQAGYPARRHN